MYSRIVYMPTYRTKCFETILLPLLHHNSFKYIRSLGVYNLSRYLPTLLSVNSALYITTVELAYTTTSHSAKYILLLSKLSVYIVPPTGAACIIYTSTYIRLCEILIRVGLQLQAVFIIIRFYVTRATNEM